MATDLRASTVPLSSGAFARVVRDGALADRAMPAFAAFENEELESLRHYLRAKAHVDAGALE